MTRSIFAKANNRANSEQAKEVDSQKRALELEELRLKIAELQRPFWQSPAVATSLVIALATGAAGYFSGFFQLQLDKQKLETDKLEVAHKVEAERRESANKSMKLETDRIELANDRVRFESEQIKLQRSSLNGEIASLRAKVDNLDGQRASLEKKTKELLPLKRQVSDLTAQRSGLERRTVELNEVLQDALRPRLNIIVERHPGATKDKDNRFSVTLQNVGTGPIKLLPFDLYVDNTFVTSTTNTDNWRLALENLRVNEPWVRFFAMGGVPEQFLTLEAGTAQELLGIFEGEHSEARVRRMMRAGDKLGIVACYCSRDKCTVFRHQPLPESATDCRTKYLLTDMKW